MRTFDEMRGRFSVLYEAVKKSHTRSRRMHQGHGLDHDVTVAMLGVKIAPDLRTGDLAFIAGLLHSSDRTIRRPSRGTLSNYLINQFQYLPPEIQAEEWRQIYVAVMNHSEINNDGQTLTQQTLMDADRLANLMGLVLFRIGQFWPAIPTIEFEHVDKPNPASTYQAPCSTMDMLRAMMSQLGGNNVGYIEQLRLPKAIELGELYSKRLNLLLDMIKDDHHSLGLAGIKL